MKCIDDRLRVAVLLGGNSSERAVSLKSGRCVANALEPNLYKVQVFDPAVDLARIIKAAPQIDVALVMLHGPGGEDGRLQGFLDLLGIPYQCAGVLGCALAMDKPLAKDRFRLAGIPVARDLVLHRGQTKAAERVLDELGLPVVVKPAQEGSSFGISIVKFKTHLPAAIKSAFELGDRVLVEEFLEGREITGGVIGNHNPYPLPLVEIIPAEKYQFFDYEAKYIPGASNEICPAPLDQKTTELIQELSLKAHQALGLMGYSRSDFILTEQGPVILETNTIPGMTETSLFPQAARQAGMTMPALLARLIELALERKRK